MHNKRQCLIGIILKSQKGGQVSRKRGQKGGLGGQGPKRRAKGGHGRAPPIKEGSSAAMGGSYYYRSFELQHPHAQAPA